MRPRSQWNGVRYRLTQLRWKLRILRSNLEVVALDVKDWLAWRWGTPRISKAEPFDAPVQGGRGQRLEIRVADAHPSRVVESFLFAAEWIAVSERRAARRMQA